MKNNNFTSFVTALVIGLIIGGGVVGLIWHNTSKKSSSEALLKPVMQPSSSLIKDITWAERKDYFNEFKRTSGKYYWTLTTILLYRPQYDAMTELLGKNPRLKCFKLIPGIVGDPTSVVVVSAVDSSGQNDTKTPPVLTPKDPCPPMCDDTTATPHD